MNQILNKIKLKLSEITELDLVTIGEPEGDIPNSVRYFANIDDNGEIRELLGNIKRVTYLVSIRVGAINPQAWSETALNKVIDLSYLVKQKIRHNATLDGLVKTYHLPRISTGLLYLDANSERYARVRELAFEFIKYEPAL